MLSGIRIPAINPNKDTAMRPLRFLVAFLCMLAATGTLRADLFLNELGASNVLAYRNADGGYEDWIEIHNSGPAAVDLAGWSLSNDAGLGSAWRIPSGRPAETTVPEGGFLILIADGETGLGADHLGFRLAREGGRVTLIRPDGISIADAVTYNRQSADVSWGRHPDGTSAWGFMSPPTPGAYNQAAYAGVCAEPVIETAPGFYQGSVNVTVRPGGAEETVRYTVDGEDPDESSPVVTGSAAVNQTCVFRARGFKTGFLPGPIATASYFLNESSTLPAVSLVIDPNDLYDPDTGIYVHPGSDTDQGHDGRMWERRAFIEYFPDREAGFRMPGGLRTQGNSSPDSYAKQSYRIHFRDGYGDGRLDHPLFPGDSVESFRNLVLRAGYDDGLDPGEDNTHSGTLIRDPLLTELWRRTGYLVSQDRLSTLFLNGGYHGIFDLKQSMDENFVKDHLGYEDLDMMRTRWDSTELVYGSRDEWRSLIAFFDANTFESDAMLAQAADRMDLENYATVLAVSHAAVFYSWTYGTFMIREKKPDARWIWTVWDGYRIYTKTNWNPFTSTYSPIEVYLRNHITDKLLQNTSFRTSCINRTADLLNTLFEPASVRAVIDSLAEVIRPEAARDAERWGTTFEAWEENVQALRDYADRQPDIVRSQIMDHFHLSGTARLDLGISGGSGRIRVNSVTPEILPWSGVYFRGVPVTLTAIPDPGFRFAGWTDPALPFAETVTWTPDGDRSASAVFVPVGPVNCQVTAPSRVLRGRRFPVVVRIRDVNWDIDPIRQAPVTVRAAGAHADTVFRISRGAGTGVLLSSAPSDFVLSVGNAAVPETRNTVSVPASWPSTDVSGTLPAGETVWEASSDRVVTSDLTVPAGSRLVIRPGTWVLIRKNVNIKIRGSLVVEGTENDPVLFVPENWSEPWGGLDFRAASGAFRWCFFVNGGGDDSKGQPSVTPSSPSYEWHTGRQHILYANGRSDLNLDHCFILNSRGKALGAHFSSVTQTNCVTSFVWHGGELHWSRLFCRDSHFMNLPNDDGIYTGDIDTDAFHIDFLDPDRPDYSVIDRCFFVTGKDDAVDQHGARLRITNCWMEGFQHEALAASGGDTVKVFNTVALNCDTGFESAWTDGGASSGPHVFVDHCVAAGNRVAGLRIGDDYASRSASEYRCTLTATNTVLHGNGDNVMNHILRSGSPIPGAMAVSWSLTNDADADGLEHNRTGIPAFDDAYFLMPGSPGYGMAADGTDMGRQDSTALTAGSLVINEIMYNAPPDADTGDWIELANPANRPRDMTGWTLRDEDDGHVYRMPSGVTIPENGTWVFCRDLAAFLRVHPGVSNCSGGIPFGFGAGDQVRLYAPSGLRADAVAYANGGAWPEAADGGGYSLELISPFLDNAAASNWARSKRRNGTPGETNRLPASAESAGPAGPAAFSLSQNYPNPFNPSASVEFTLPRPAAIRLEVFDVRGRRAAVVIDGIRMNPGVHRALLDGRGLAGGVYLYRMTAAYEDGRRDVRIRKMALIR